MIAADTATDQMEDLHIGCGKNLFAADTWHDIISLIFHSKNT
jgi:hypothetical protein